MRNPCFPADTSCHQQFLILGHVFRSTALIAKALYRIMHGSKPKRKRIKVSSVLNVIRFLTTITVIGTIKPQFIL